MEFDELMELTKVKIESQENINKAKIDSQEIIEEMKLDRQREIEQMKLDYQKELDQKKIKLESEIEQLKLEAAKTAARKELFARAVTTIGGGLLTIYLVNKGLKFEETGSISSFTTKNLLTTLFRK